MFRVAKKRKRTEVFKRKDFSQRKPRPYREKREKEEVLLPPLGQLQCVEERGKAKEGRAKNFLLLSLPPREMKEERKKKKKR